ncbi:hypothetical protein PVK06_003542 [Gossypium arboreum]|uniref:Disease resistance protein Roq1-like winged-helix domain-containing protein n=1 Tax=Gossypium arboreum TaxID=29729 RepID=A0ABR0R812_GOSAR|nr:hypothetical protein PVK06_003542 [Gossypium arboreum]
MAYARSLVKLCGGLPLALQVLGSSLSSKSVSSWKSALEKLEEIPDNKIQKILRISYDSLEDDHDKNLFLDIVCLFIGKDRDYTTTILDGCDFYTTIGIENLVGRSLLTINENKKLMMHQMIRDMGREIIRQESSDIGKRSRLWHKDAFDVIREKIGSKTIKCLTLDLKGLQKTKAKRTTTTLHFPKHSKSQFLMSNDVDMETQAFAKMKRLKLLQLDNVRFKGDFKDFPKRLRWLRWHGFCMQYFPVDFDINELVVLDMRGNKLKQVRKDRECLPNLKILNLNHSHSLLKTPSFSGLPSLEKLMLKDCINLVEVDQSIASNQMLELLPSVHIFNETKRIMLRYCSSVIGIPQTNDNTMLWLIHWPVTDCQFEGGDLVSCMVVPIHLSIRKFGFTYESEHNIRYEYGFSHLPTDDGTYAMKKVLIQNNEQLEFFREDIRVSSSFSHRNLLPLLDHAIISVKPTQEGSWNHDAYLLFPVHLDGTLLDNFKAMSAKNDFFSTSDVLQIFRQDAV